MFPEVSRLMQDANVVIDILPEDKDDEVLGRAEIRLKRENARSGIDLLVMSFYGKVYKSGIFL